MPELWSARFSSDYFPGLILCSAFLLAFWFLVSLAMIHSALLRPAIQRSWIVIVWVSLLLWGAIPAMLWHAQPHHVWYPTLVFAGLFSLTWWAPWAIHKRYMTHNRQPLTPD